MILRLAGVLTLSIWLAASALADEGANGAFDAHRTQVGIRINEGDWVHYSTFFTTVLPGETLRIALSEPAHLNASDQTHRQFDWTAPDTQGVHPLRLQTANGERLTLNVFVARGRGEIEHEALDGYRLGSYPSEPFRGLDAYAHPERFIAVSEANWDTPVSPHFTLGQFACKQPGSPRYVVLNERLILKLEMLLEAVNDAGWEADTFHVMSGYRTPSYNAGIGNGRHSRHVYGGAADIFIDMDGDGVMDDLNRDGRLDRADAAALYDLVERFADAPTWSHLEGGLGEYGPNAVHGAFVHVDERGYRARWGR